MATEQHVAGVVDSPLEQFAIETILPLSVGPVNISFTNSALWMCLAVIVTLGFMLGATYKKSLIPGYWQLTGEMFYLMIANMVNDSVGNKGKIYFPFIFTLFMFVLFGNMLGLLPTGFTFTSHIAVTFFMAAVIFIAVTVLGIFLHGGRFFSLFLPHGTPWFLAPILIPIEMLSYLSRPVSLSVRLFANMVVGHVLLKVLAGFVILMGVFGVIPFVSLVAITALEVLVAFIQAYVFAILTCVYLHDALYLH